jgi:hypothetical protein
MSGREIATGFVAYRIMGNRIMKSKKTRLVVFLSTPFDGHKTSSRVLFSAQLPAASFAFDHFPSTATESVGCRLLPLSSPHDQDNRAVLNPAQVQKIMLDVFELAEFACPSAIRELSGGVRRYAIVVGEKRDLLKSGLHRGITANCIAQSRKSIVKRWD